MNRIWQIVNVSDSHFAILPDGQTIYLDPKNESIKSVSQIVLKTYMKHNKFNKYLSLPKYEKLKIIFAYLTRKFLKMYKFQDYNKLIYKLILKMKLSNGIIQLSEFKSEVLKFYNMISDFSIEDREINNDSLTNLTNELVSFSDSPLNNSKKGSVKASSIASLAGSEKNTKIRISSKIKSSNYMVIKPMVDIKLPRKQTSNNGENTELVLQRIHSKGNKHFQKFIRFKMNEDKNNDCLDSIYARYQSRLKRIKLGKFYLKSISKIWKQNNVEKAESLFFFSYKFNMKNNKKLLHSIFMGIDSYMWMSRSQRQFYYRRINQDVLNKKWFITIRDQIAIDSQIKF